jgi:tetratricopeptide (TPR) repeat protein
MAGMITLGEESNETRVVPKGITAEEGDAALMDKEMVTALRREWLRVSGRNFYEMLSVSTSAPAPQVQAAINSYKERFDPARMRGGNLGPAAAIGRDLATMLDLAEATLLDEKGRSEYDQTLHLSEVGPAAAAKPQNVAENTFLEGRKLLAGGKSREAHASFMKAHQIQPDDAEYLAYAGWALFLAGGPGATDGLGLINQAKKLNPSAMRPIFFLGLAALQKNNVALAQKYLTEAARRVPDDPDVKVALGALPQAEHAMQVIDF